MKYYIIILSFFIVVIVSMFFIGQLFGISIMDDPTAMFQKNKWLAALTGIVLLILDVFLPVPSSLVMIANGAFFGILYGTILSIIGNVGAAVLGYGFGVTSSKAIKKFIPKKEQIRAETIIQKWGNLGVILSRPVPVLAEAISIFSGFSKINFSAFMVAIILGTTPISITYAIAGFYAINLDNSFLVFGFVLLVAGFFWIIGNWYQKRIK